ncbi:MAG TPA: ABC transporter permease [Jiangellales bacterium]|nr:ABC transporter permease [Jiangellales bacterium]
MTTPAVARALGHRSPQRPPTPALVATQLGYAVRELWRTRIVLIFTAVLPLVWLAVIGLLAGNALLDDGSGIRVMQFATPAAAAMGILYASYPTLAISLSLARDQGILKRIRGTPLPAWTYLVGRIGGAVTFALGSLLALVLLGGGAYSVQVVWRTVPATVVTVALGIACFAALGLAVAALSPSASVAQAVSIATAVLLTFVSDLFTFGAESPAWLSRLGSVFPLKHLVRALQGQFDPFATGAGLDLTALAVMAAWLLGSLLVAARAFRWDPPAGGARRTAGAASRPDAGTPAVAATAPGRPSYVAMGMAQARFADRAAWRDPGWVFFAVAMPVGLYAFMSAMYGDSGFRPDGLPFAQWFAAGMIAYGAGVTAFINMPEAVATARDRGILKRLRGTPLPPGLYLAGRTATVVWIAGVTAVLVLATGLLFFDLEVSVAGLLPAAFVLALGTVTMGACGLALASVVPDSKAMTAVGLAILLPLSFFSDVFPVGDPPAWMGTVGSLFPLQHLSNALMETLDPSGPSLSWVHVAVMLAWLAGAALVAARRFRWDPGQGRTG